MLFRSNYCCHLLGWVLLLSGMTAWPVLAQTETVKWKERQFYHEGVLRQYRYTADTADTRVPATVLLLLHDGGQNYNRVFDGEATPNRHWINLARQEGFILLVPNGTHLKSGQGRGQNLHWNDCRPDMRLSNRRSGSDDVTFMRKVLLDLGETSGIQINRIFATGAGKGGLMALRLAFEAPDLVSAVAAVHCNLPLNSACKSKGVPVPILLMNGNADSRFPWVGGDIDGNRGSILSVPRSRNMITNYNYSDTQSARKAVLPPGETGLAATVQRDFYPGTQHGADVCFYTLIGGNHELPSKQYPGKRKKSGKTGSQNRDIEMADEVWRFLRSYYPGVSRFGDWMSDPESSDDANGWETVIIRD
jgi:polyhydroxybutyrate depolymerase